MDAVGEPDVVAQPAEPAQELDRPPFKVMGNRTLLEIAENMTGKTICVLSDSCAAPVVSGLQKFRNEFEALITGKRSSSVAVPEGRKPETLGRHGAGAGATA